MAELDLTRVSFRNMTFEAICDLEIVGGLWSFHASLSWKSTQPPPPFTALLIHSFNIQLIIAVSYPIISSAHYKQNIYFDSSFLILVLLFF